LSAEARVAHVDCAPPENMNDEEKGLNAISFEENK
jgi:hypothetical protein